jgi:hypothetical protein
VRRVDRLDTTAGRARVVGPAHLLRSAEVGVKQELGQEGRVARPEIGEGALPFATPLQDDAHGVALLVEDAVREGDAAHVVLAQQERLFDLHDRRGVVVEAEGGARQAADAGREVSFARPVVGCDAQEELVVGATEAVALGAPEEGERLAVGVGADRGRDASDRGRPPALRRVARAAPLDGERDGVGGGVAEREFHLDVAGGLAGAEHGLERDDHRRVVAHAEERQLAAWDQRSPLARAQGDVARQARRAEVAREVPGELVRAGDELGRVAGEQRHGLLVAAGDGVGELHREPHVGLEVQGSRRDLGGGHDEGADRRCRPAATGVVVPRHDGRCAGPAAGEQEQRR